MATALILVTKINHESGFITAEMRKDSGVYEGLTFQESRYLPDANWTNDDLAKAIAAASEDLESVAFAVINAQLLARAAQDKVELDARVAQANADAAQAIATLGRPPITVEDNLASVAQGIQDAANRYATLTALHANLTRVQAEADAIRVRQEQELATTQAAAAKEKERQQIIQATTDAIAARFVLTLKAENSNA